MPEGSNRPNGLRGTLIYSESVLTKQSPELTADLKRSLRRTARRIRAGVPPEVSASAADAICRIGIAFFQSRNPAVVSGYAATRGELDVLPLLHALHERGVSTALPVVAQDSLELVFRAYRPGDVLQKAGFNLLEPGSGAGAVTPQAMLAPLLAFDARGGRLGYGGGYFDATLKRLRAHNAGLLAVGVAFDEQEVEAIPRESHDELLDWVLTPSGPIRCGE